MSKYVKALTVSLISIISILMLFSCSIGGGGTGGTEGEKTYKVSLIAPDGVTVTSQNPQTVKEGEDASFVLSVEPGFVFVSATKGDYDRQTSTLTIKGITADTRAEIVFKRSDYDTSVKYKYFFHGLEGDKSSPSSGKYSAGERVTVTAGAADKVFAGWSLGNNIKSGGELLSREKEYTFELSPALAKDTDEIHIYANYTEGNIMYYDLNGGKLNLSSQNIKNTTYYTAADWGNSLKVTIKSSYLELAGAASTFYDDGSFVRDGYVLAEYNTKADGSGEGYSLGSKFPLNLGTDTLYCIWKKDSLHSDFKYTDVHFGYASGTDATKAPHWVTDGIRITKYTGSDKEVVIPEKIDGKYVTAIAAGAFDGCTSMETLVMHRFILSVERGAFKGCSSLSTVYYPDGIYNIYNDSFDKESWSGIRNFYVNATMAPRYSTADGSFALKFTRLLANSDKKRIIVIAGSSSFQGLSTEYFEALVDGEYTLINFGTTRTTHGYLYLEAMQHYASEDDIILYAPENSIYMYGEPTLYWKTLRDMEGMYNLFRYIDIQGYENVLGAFAELNRGDDSALDKNTSPRYKRNPQRYEDAINRSGMNEYGEYIYPERRAEYVNADYFKDYYEITLNDRVKSLKEGVFSNSVPSEEPWQTSDKWCSIKDDRYTVGMNRAIAAAKSSGALVLFSFAPADASKLCAEAKADLGAWIDAYEKMILEVYEFDGILGECESYVFAHEYFYDNAYHTNDYGRVWRTYALYLDIARLGGKTDLKGHLDEGNEFEGCLFEESSDSTPKYN